MTLQDLLDDDGLGLTCAVEGDLGRTVRWVHVTEMTDPSPYLAGDELVLTAGLWRGRGASAMDFVCSLESRSCAGIGYGLLREDEKVPAALMKACRQEGVSLLVVPMTTPFIAISQRFVQQMALERESELRASLDFTAELLSSAERAEPEDALQALMNRLRTATGCSCWTVSGDGRLIAYAGSRPDPRLVAETLARTTSDAVLTVRPVRHGDDTVALVALAGADQDRTLAARLDASLPVVALVLSRQRAVRDTERKLAGEVITLVLDRQVDAAAARLASYGIGRDRILVAMVAMVSGDSEKSLQLIEKWLEAEKLTGIAATKDGQQHLLLALPEKPGVEDLRWLGHRYQLASGSRSTGVGSITDRFADLRKSIVQAMHASRWAEAEGGGVALAADLAGSHSLLLALQDADVISSFQESLLGPLRRHDDANSSDLLATLRAFLSNGARWQQTAETLNIHVNTLRYRLARIETLTSKDLNRTGDRVDLWLALQTYGEQP